MAGYFTSEYAVNRFCQPAKIVVFTFLGSTSADEVMAALRAHHCRLATDEQSRAFHLNYPEFGTAWGGDWWLRHPQALVGRATPRYLGVRVADS